MNTEQLEAQWQEVAGKLKKKYGEAIDDEIIRAKGATDEVVGKLRQKLNKTEEEVREELDDLLK
jgi:uncharacterized protein YjbJ (UPF0337 family)